MIFPIHLCLPGLCRGDCDELKSIALPLSGDTTITLSGDQVCDLPETDPDEQEILELLVIEGGTLTLTGPSTTM